MSDIASKLSRLSPAQRALLQKRRRTVAPARDPQAPAPLSFAQQRLWFVQQLAPDSTAYNMTITLRLRGPLDASAMQKAFDGLVARHAALRSCYRPDADGNPQQMAGTAPRLALIDCADATARRLAARGARGCHPCHRVASHRGGPLVHGADDPRIGRAI